MEFLCNFAENGAKRSKTRVSYAWLLLLTLFGFGSYVVEHTYGGEKVIACYMRAFQMTFDFNNRSSLEFH